MNRTYGDIYGFFPLPDEAVAQAARTYAMITHPRLLKVVVDTGGEIVGFFLGIRDITEGVRRARGRVLPLGYLKIKLHQTRAGRLDLLLGAVREEYRGKGIDTLLGIAMVKSARELGLEYADSHHELESNRMIRSEMEKLGGVVYKRYRVYRKDLQRFFSKR
jgi:GNAT superfamily N-acetyltransferase